ncbi:hypothetical protein Cni_G06817 [Canna indica]|uniref:Ribosomal protein S5 domain 2-like superfamily protein n=1 Tax=Canna indica TaxID=4628 RepID=A0AAQ3Q6S2_9LILI|nr:hypothetical protein Cni_G06817 [Canna indica]
MLSRSASLRLPLRFLTLATAASTHSRRILSSPPIPPPPHFPPTPPLLALSIPNSFLYQSLRPFSSKRGDDNDDGDWKFTPEIDEGDSVFGDEAKLADGAESSFRSESASAGANVKSGDPWEKAPVTEGNRDIFDDIDLGFAAKGGSGGGGVEDWETAEGYKPWTLGGDDEKEDLFDVGEGGAASVEGIDNGDVEDLDKPNADELKQLEKREEELLATLKGPNRSFGDLVASSGITEDMIDSLILLKDVRGVPGLPPLSEIEDKYIAKMNATSTRTEIERKKQEEIAKSRVRQVDEKGRAYGTGRRKCSIARVWIKPGDGKFIVNEKQFDAYFPILDQRAELLRPFTVTKTLGLWDVNCTVKGGGVSGQVGAIRLGISRALQNWEPGLRPYLKSAGYLTRDPRVVERKKPGKAKARKSFQWVKR